MTNINDMRVIKVFVLLTLGLLAFASCRKEAIESQGNGTQAAREEKYLAVTFSAGLDEFRLAQLVKSTGEVSTPFMEERDPKIRLVVRQKGDSRVKVQDVVFKKVAPVAGVAQPRATYTGKVLLPEGVSTQAGASFEVSGMLLGESVASGTEFLRTGDTPELPVRTTTNEALLIADSQNKIASKIPYILDWTEMKVSGDGSRFETTTLRFNPSGSILRFRLYNESAQSVTAHSLRIKTNTFFTDWMYDSTDPLAAGNFLAGKRDNVDIWEKEFVLPNGDVELTANTGVSDKFYYLWVMPARADAQTRLDIEVIDNKGGRYKAFGTSTKTGMLNMGSKLVNLRIRAPKESIKIPLEYLAEYNVAAGGTSFSTTHKNNVQAHFTWDQAVALNIDGYYLPSRNHWWSILHKNVYDYSQSINDLNVSEDGIMLPGDGTTNTFTADYKSDPAKKTLYAVRFKDAADNSKVVVYRYRLVGTSWDSSDLDSHLEIKSMYVGKSFIDSGKTVADIMSDSYWTNADVKTRILPAEGFQQAAIQLGARGYYWSSTQTETPPNASGYMISFTSMKVDAVSNYVKTYKYPVRLFSRN